MLVDLDYFFAQCEELKNPSIKDKPVVVGVYSGRSEESGAVSTANYVARKFGVKSGMPIFLAKRKLANSNAIFLPVDHLFYEEISEKVMNVLRAHADRFQQVGIDEAYLDVTNTTEGRFEAAEQLARRIKNELQNNLQLTCSIGVGPNKLVAKIAADIIKPNGLTLVKPEQVESFLSPLPIGNLIGVGAKTKEKMEALGIHTIFDLANYKMQNLATVFGKTLATYFHRAALGADDEPVESKGPAESISRISTLKQDSHDLTFILEKTGHLCDEIYATARIGGQAFKTVGIIAATDDMTIHTRSKSLEKPTKNLEELKQTVKELIERLLNENERNVRRIGVKVSNLTKELKSQKQLTSFFSNA